MSNDKFLQPEDGIVIIKRAKTTTLTPETLEFARERIARGEPADEVAAELAQIEVDWTTTDEELEEIGKSIRTASAAPETLVHRAADGFTMELDELMTNAFTRAKAAMRPKLKNRDSVKEATALAIITLRQELKDTLPPMMAKMFIAGGEAGAQILKPRFAELRTAKKDDRKKKKREEEEEDIDRVGLDFVFDAATEAAISWADKHAAEFIKNITETTRETINNAVAEFLETGEFEELKDEILEAVGDDDRAYLIARNEPMIAVHEGQREAWAQASEQGLLTGKEEREWIIVGDEAVCPICEGLEGKRAVLGGSYTGEDGEEYDGPPAHVSCRCSEGIV